MKRERIFLSDWRFFLGELENGWYAGNVDAPWKDVKVPHDWAVEHPFSTDNSSGTGYLPGGTGWYRTSFEVPEGFDGRAVITFEGVYNNSQVWINSNYLGKRPYGYSTFEYDVTEFLRGGENTVCVKVNHTQTADSRWYTGSGIVRPVYVDFTDKHAVTNVFVSTKEITKDFASLDVKVETTSPLTIKNTVVGEDGDIIKNPRLWSPDSPHLYTLLTEAFDHGEKCDEVTTVFGVREFRFDAKEGFFLNGENIKLLGVCVHHDAGALGAAVPKDVWRRRLEKLKAVGCNAIRTSHNPPDVTLLDLCDEMGFLVMDEAFDEWAGPKNKWWQGHNVYPPKLFGYFEDFPAWGEKDIKAMVRRDRNHPSIIMYSIGNEVDYPNDPYCHPSFGEMTGNNDANKPVQERRYDPNRPNAKRLASIARQLVGYIKEEDTTRPVTAALAFPELSNLTGYADSLDIVGYNYKEHLYKDDCEKYPDRVIYGSENSHSPDAWAAVQGNKNICGQFLWTGVDYLGEAHGWPVRASGAGLLDLAGFEKPQYYMRKIMWTKNPDAELFVHKHIKETEHRPRHRRPPLVRGWNFESGEEVEVVCFTNCDEAELYINGIRQDERIDFFGNFAWRCRFEEGEVKVVCKKGGETVERKLVTTGSVSSLKFNALRDGAFAQVEVFLADKDGNVVANSDAELSFESDGEIIGIENGDTADLTPYYAKHRKTKNGRLIVYLRGEKLNLTARGEGIEGSVDI